MEDFLLEDIASEEEQPSEGFVIDSDLKADWAVEKIQSRRKERDRLVSLYEAKIAKLQADIATEKDNCSADTAYLMYMLNQYFGTVEARETKTKYSYKLASGNLELTKGSVDFKRDDKALGAFLASQMPQYAKAEYKPLWKELKASGLLEYSTENGEVFMIDRSTGDVQIIEGVTAVEKPPVFDIK